MRPTRKRMGRFFVGQDVTLLPDEHMYGHVVGFDRDGSVMVKWVGPHRVVTGVSPRNLRGLPPGYAGPRSR